jgi:hypothetical protein
VAAFHVRYELVVPPAGAVLLTRTLSASSGSRPKARLNNFELAHRPVAVHLRIDDVPAWSVLKFVPRRALAINSVARIDGNPSGSMAMYSRWRTIRLCHDQVGWVRYHRRRGENGKDQTYAPEQCDVSCHDWTSYGC